MYLLKTMIQILPDEHFSSPYTIYCPPPIYAKVEKTPNLYLAFGQKTALVTLKESPDFLQMSESLATFIHFPTESVYIQTHYDAKTNTLRLGPLFAVLATRIQDIEKPFGTLSGFFSELARTSVKENILFYAFSLEDCRNDEILGFMFHNGAWKQACFPYPDVIYNRLSTRQQENSEQAHSFFSHCSQLGIPIFNDRFLDKWEVHQLLANHPEIVPHLPETILYRKAYDLDAMLQKYPTLYLKPIHGSLGKRIVKIVHDGNHYTVSYSAFPSFDQKQTSSLLDLFKDVMPNVKRHLYIIQQGIKTIQYHKRPIDFRILCNKDEYGKWQVVSSVARVSAEQQFVSNVAMGGTVHRLEHVLNHVFGPNEARGLKRLMYELALQCAAILEWEVSGIYGEFGIDLAMDLDGKPWLIEINTKPSKTEEAHARMTKIRPSAKAIVLFSSSLTVFRGR